MELDVKRIEELLNVIDKKNYNRFELEIPNVIKISLEPKNVSVDKTDKTKKENKPFTPEDVVKSFVGGVQELNI